MKMNKKFLMMMTLAAMSLTFVGCDQTVIENKPETIITEEGSDAVSEEAVSEEVTEETMEIEQTDETEEAVEEVVEEGYIGEKDPTPSDEVYFTITNGLPEAMSMTADDDMLKDAYGIDPEILASHRVEVGTNRAKVFELAVFEVKDASDIEKVKEGIAKRGKDLEAQWGSYLEDQLELVKNAQTVVNGNRVLYVVSYDAGAIVEAFNSIQ